MRVEPVGLSDELVVLKCFHCPIESVGVIASLLEQLCPVVVGFDFLSARKPAFRKVNPNVADCLSYPSCPAKCYAR